MSGGCRIGSYLTVLYTQQRSTFAERALRDGGRRRFCKAQRIVVPGGGENHSGDRNDKHDP